MRLLPILPDFASKLQAKARRISKELAYNIATERVRPNSLILLGNGDPDDQVLAILCHHFDGEKVVGIVKSELTRTEALRNLPLYLGKLKSLSTIIEVLDQEDDSLSSILSQVEDTLRDKNIKYNLNYESERVSKYECVFGSRKFDLIIVVSGLGNPNSEKYNVEEHLVTAAIEIGKLEPFQGNKKIDPKAVWRRIPQSERLEVLRQFLSRKSFAKETFPQHWEGLGLIP